MAKSKSFFGMRRGSTKSLTFSVVNGMQITKDRVSEVKNPRSVQQMKQRCILKTAALGYAAMKAIVDHSFQGYTYGSQSMRQFMKVNTPLVKTAAGSSRPSFGFAPYGDSTPNMGQFIISEGTLSPVPYNAVSLTFSDNSLAVKYNGGGGSVSELAASLGCNLGDIATICALCQNSDGIVKFVWLRLILPSADGAISSDTVKFESDVRFSVSYGAELVATISFDEVDAITASTAALYGVIRSQKAESGWLRSVTRLNHSVGAVRYLDEYSKAILTYPMGQPFILNGDNVGEQEAAPLPTYNVTVANATSSVIKGEGAYTEGTTVTLTASVAGVGKTSKWEGVPDGSGSTTTKTGNSISFVMPADDVAISYSVEDVTLYNIQDWIELDKIGAEVSPYEDVAEGEEVTFGRTSGDTFVYEEAYLANAETSEKWKDLPVDLASGQSSYIWKINMPAFNLKVVITEQQ